MPKKLTDSGTQPLETMTLSEPRVGHYAGTSQCQVTVGDFATTGGCT